MHNSEVVILVECPELAQVIERDLKPENAWTRHEAPVREEVPADLF